MSAVLLAPVCMHFGDWLLLKRRELGLGQEEVCQALGVNRNTISNWERKVTTPSLSGEQLTTLVKLLKVNVEGVPLKAVTRYEPDKDHSS